MTKFSFLGIIFTTIHRANDRNAIRSSEEVAAITLVFMVWVCEWHLLIAAAIFNLIYNIINSYINSYI